jgi:perosamine synthetase
MDFTYFNNERWRKVTNRISYVKPSITHLEIEKATEAATLGWGVNYGTHIREFENNFSDKIGSPFGIATSSCTGALHLGLAGMGIGEGDEVILADTNWVATLAPLHYLGAKPVFVDIREDTWCIDASLIKDKITKKTKAIIATHLYGNLCDMDSLSAIAKEFNLFLIEDSAEAIGSVYKGSHAGTIGDFGVFSFHGSKTITTGEGGMLTTGNKELEERVRMLNNLGRSVNESRQFWPSEIGYKYKMTDIQAAIGIAQVSRFDELVNRKREIMDYYRENLRFVSDINFNPLQNECESGAWMPNAVFSKESGLTRDKLCRLFQEANIDARVFFWPLSELGFYESVNNPVARDISNRSINLPSYHDMTSGDQERVLNVIRIALKSS